jgi:hypothetical protein
MQDDCLICGHPCQAELDAFIQAVDDPSDFLDDHYASRILEQMNKVIEGIYGEEATPVDLKTLRVHAFQHPIITDQGQIVVLEDARMVRADGRYLTVPTLHQAIALIMAMGQENLRLHPEDVKPHHLLKAMALASHIGLTFNEEELEQLLLQKIQEKPHTDGNRQPLLPPVEVEVGG